MEKHYTITFTEDELIYALVMLCEGQDSVNEKPSLKNAYNNFRTQESVIEKVRKKCWDIHYDKP